MNAPAIEIRVGLDGTVITRLHANGEADQAALAPIEARIAPAIEVLRRLARAEREQ